MSNILLIISLLTYGCCVHLNYLLFKDLMKNEMDKDFAKRFWIYLLSGPILTGIVIYRKVKKQRRKKEIMKSLMKQIPQLLKEYNITAEDGVEEQIPNIIEETLK